MFVKQKLMKTEVITCPTYPSLLHTQTSFCPPSVGEAHVNWSPALVLRIGTEEMNSGVGCFSTLVANFCLASVNVSSHWVRFSGFENTTVIVWAPVLEKTKHWKDTFFGSNIKTYGEFNVNSNWLNCESFDWRSFNCRWISFCKSLMVSSNTWCWHLLVIFGC